MKRVGMEVVALMAGVKKVRMTVLPSSWYKL